MDKERRAYYLKHIYHSSFKVAELKRQKKLKAIELKGGKCERCQGTFEPCVYDFHHVDPSLKESAGSQFLNRSWENAVKELDKCILLCANCHRIEHANRSRQPPRH